MPQTNPPRFKAIVLLLAAIILISLVGTDLWKAHAKSPLLTHGFALRLARLITVAAQTPPAAPGNLTITQVNNVTGNVTLTWTDNSADETGFKAEVKSVSGWNEFRRLGANTTSITNYSVPLTNRAIFRVRAYNAYGDSAYSNEATAPVVNLDTISDAAQDAPGNFHVAADASDPEGIARVEFHVGEYPNYQLAFTDEQEPYVFNWANVPKGFHYIVAKAFDNDGDFTQSSYQRVWVRERPTATITAPLDDDHFGHAQSVQISATAQLNNERIDEYLTRMDFYANNTLIGTVEGPGQGNGSVRAYNFTWTNPPDGFYLLTTRPVSSYESVGTSPTVRVTVGDAGFNVRGRIAATSGSPLYGVRITLSGDTSATATTDANGEYTFANLAPGGNFTVSPSTSGYTFAPASRTLSNLNGHQTANFAGTPAPPPDVDYNAAPLSQQPPDGRATLGPSSKKITGKLIDGEVADDFDLSAAISRVRVYGQWDGYETSPNPRYNGVYVRFYDAINNAPGNLQSEYFLPRGAGGVLFDAANPTAFDITLPQPFRATGRHFISVQPLFEDAWWNVRSGGYYPTMRGAAWRVRDNLAGGVWGTGATSNYTASDMAMELYGATLIPPSISTFSQTTVTRSGLIRISGTHFGDEQGDSQLLVDGKPAIIADWSDTLVNAYVPEGASLGSVPLSLTTAGGTASETLNVTARRADGRVRWRFTMAADRAHQRAALGQDGTIYLNDATGHLYALTPAGALKWVFRAGSAGAVGSVSVGADGTIYVAGAVARDAAGQCPASSPESIHAVFAVNADGTQKWVFDETCGSVAVGPNIGSDGKIYGVAGTGGIGAFALNPDGSLAWNDGEYLSGDGAEIVFGGTAQGLAPSQFYFQTTTVLNKSLFGYSFAGQKLFETLTGTTGQPAVAPLSGDLFAVTLPASGVYRLNSYTPQGASRWESPVSPTSNLSTPDAASDGTLYVVQDAKLLHAIEPSTGEPRWSYDAPHLLAAPVASTDNRLVLLGGRVAADSPGLFAAVGVDGQLLWKQQLPDELSLNPRGLVVPNTRARFTADGQTAYIAADIISDSPAAASIAYFYALDTSAGDLRINQPPAVTLTSPTGGAIVPKNTQVQLTANVQDDDAVVRVEFYRSLGGNVQRIATDTSAEAGGVFSVSWTPTEPGAYDLYAVAYDLTNLTTKSQPVQANVSNEPPQVEWVSPHDGVSFAQGQSVTLTAQANDTDGRVVKVEFSSSQLGLIGEDTTADAAGNYSTLLVNPNAGAHQLTARATDEDGATTSVIVNITIDAVATPTPVPGTPTVAWERTFHGGGVAAGYEPVMAVDHQGNSIVAGRSFLPNHSSNTDIIVVKYSPTGNQLWTRSYSGVGSFGDWPTDVKTDVDGNIYVAGTEDGGANSY
ncbi:MAG TPA: Ig-like domain-containing protein, partial [Pyrinomonadaceae bacterium]|nr:Ig-like domain-containing protein [Pyrinomonadaceae bacterium]